ncbi:MAG: response regulator [Bradyrhizobium sp.]|nr:response regulator [Bradyrhizobium sp.]
MQKLNSGWQSQAVVQTTVGFLVALSIAALFVIDLDLRYNAAIDQGKTEARNFAELLSEHTALTFENVERTLREAAKIRKDSMEGDYPTAEDTNAALRLLTKTSPVVVAVGWTDAEGNVVAHSYSRPPPRGSIAEMPHFAVHRDHPGDDLYVSPPFRSTATGKWLTAASLRLNNPDGTFAGVLVTPLDQSYFTKIYRSIDLGASGSTLLMHTGGLVLTREPPLDEIIGKSFTGGRLLSENLPYADSGSYETPSVVDGQPRIAGYKAVRGLPLVQVVSYARSEVLKEWYRHIMVFGPLVALVVAAILIGTFLLVRQSRSLAEQSATLLRKSGELEQINARFDVALSHMPHGLVVWDAEQNLVIANSRFREMYGLRPEQVKSGTSLRQLLHSQVANGQDVGPDMDDFVRRIVAEPLQIQVLADGRTVAMRRRPTPEGGWITAHEDISEQKHVEAELRAARDRAESAARATSEFLANMSHELRTPLTAIIGVSDILLDRTQSPEKEQHYLEMQRSAGQGLLGVVNDILEFSKLEAGQFSLNTAALSLSGLLKECLEVISEQARRKGLNLTVNVAADVPDWVQGDVVRLRQVLLNLIGNAVKFTPSGTVCVTVEKLTAEPHAVRFAITDTGIGISAKDMTTLFQRFAQADSSTTRRFGGTGLGLAISRQLVVLMGGTIDVQSAPGRGSVFAFVVELPCCDKPVPEAAPVLPVSHDSYRLLLAEDNVVNRELIKAMLEQAGHRVVTVNDGAEAVTMTSQSAFDAILMDVQMPDMDGYTATRAIRRATADRPGLPIIALTANALPGEAERCLEAGMNAHVPKPVNWPSLLAIIERFVLGERRDAVHPLRRTMEKPVKPDASAQAAIFDNAVLARLHNSIGAMNATRLLRLFSVEAQQRFLPQSGATDHVAICREAHSFGGAADMLGFHALAKACADLQTAGQDTFDHCLAHCRAARDVALEVVTDLLGEEDYSRSGQTSA